MASDQQFCLRWNNHQNTLVSIFDSLLESGTLVDCTLAAEGRFLQAHKVVLSACSPYFAMLLREHYDKFPILILKDIKYQELQAMMNYMYRGEVNITQETLGSFLKAAESLQIRGLTDNSHCVENNNGIIRDNNSLHEPRSLYSHSNKKLSADSRKLLASGGVPASATPLISQQRPRSPPSFLTQTQSSKKYLKSSQVVIENHHHHAAAAAAVAAAAVAAANNNTNNNSKSSSDVLENNTHNSTSIKRRKLLPPIKSEGLVVTPINPSSTPSTYNNNIEASNLCEVPSQAQSIPAFEGKANVPSPSVPPKIESPHMDITPVISNKVPPITNSTPNANVNAAAAAAVAAAAAAAMADGLLKSKSSASELVKVKSEQLDDSYNEDTNDDSYTTEDNDNERDENSHFSMAGLPFHNNQSGSNFDSSTDRSLLAQDGNNSLQDSPDTRANDEIVSQFVIKLSKSLPVDYCNAMSAAQQQQQQQQQQQHQQQHCAVTVEQQSQAISTTSSFGCQPVVASACGSSLASAVAAAAATTSIPPTPPASASKVCFPCDACGNVYNYKTSLARHQRFECGKDPQFQCPFCEHRTKHKSSLTTHIDCKHKQELMYEESRAGTSSSYWCEYNGLAAASSLTKT